MSDRARVTVRVEAPREVAFAVFTSDVDTWWRRGKRFRMGQASTMAIEPRVGGRFTETERTEGGVRRWDMGEVIVWDPPKRLAIAWRGVNFEPDDPSTEVEVTFERALGLAGEGTLVTLEHRGLSRLRADHPVRHGLADAAFIASLGRFWGDLMSSLREVARG